MKRIRYYVGTELTAAGEPINPITAKDTLEALAQRLTKWAGGCTLTVGHGFYEGHKGLAIEQCVILEVMKEDTLNGIEAEARKHGKVIRDAMEQEAVFMTIESVAGEFV